MQCHLLPNDPQSEHIPINYRAQRKEAHNTSGNEMSMNVYDAQGPSVIGSPRPIRQSSDMISRKTNINHSKVEGIASLGYNNRVGDEPRVRKLNSGFIYTINDKKMKTFLIHSLPKRNQSTETQRQQSEPIKEVVPSNVPGDKAINSSNNEASKEQLQKIYRVIEQLQQKLHEIESRQSKPKDAPMPQSKSVPQDKPALAQQRKKKQKLPSIELQASLDGSKSHESPFRLKLESSIMQINMLQDKKREQESYYNQKYRLSDEIDRLKNIIRGMQIDKIKCANPHYTPYSQPKQECQQHHHHSRVDHSGSRIQDAGKIIHVHPSKPFLNPHSETKEDRERQGRRRPSHKFIESSQVIESKQLNTHTEKHRYDQGHEERDNPEEQVRISIKPPKDITVPRLPPTPNAAMAQQPLLALAKHVYQAFDVVLDEGQDITVKKYKNCVLFSLASYPHHYALWHFSGKFYMGGWKVSPQGQGEKEGEGVEISPGKHVYKGQFLSGRKNGSGIMKMQNGSIYDGQWSEGTKTGRGVFFDAVAHTIYEGQWRNNKKEGQGMLKLSDKEYYCGTFQRSIKEGFGEEAFPNADKYKGEYSNGRFHGKGKYIWANGSCYQGQFVQGMRDGQGTWKSASSQADTYTGQYKKDKKNGYGRYKWANGCLYQGEFLNDVKHGAGRITYLDGRQIKGVWKDGQLASNQEQAQGGPEQKPLQKTSRLLGATFMSPSRRKQLA